MIYSMTGYGKAQVALASGILSIEIRTLNSKGTDISIKSPLLPKDKDLLVRQKLTDALVRGTIDVFINLEATAGESARELNRPLVEEYFKQISALRDSLPGFALGDTSTKDRMNNELFLSILRFPDVMEAKKADVIDESNWPAVEAGFDAAIAAVLEYRRKGKRSTAMSPHA